MRNDNRAHRRVRSPNFLTIFLVAAATVIPVIVALMLYEIGNGSLSAIRVFGLKFLYGTDWIPFPAKGGLPILGALPFIYGSIVTTTISLLLAVPVSLGVALFQAELSPRALRVPSVFVVEMLAAVPSVVYGLWALLVLVPVMRVYVDPSLQVTLGFLPLFSGFITGLGMLSAGVILAIMIIPYASSVVREVITAVPRSQREASLALGATSWETIRTSVLPFARTGIIAAIVLALGRAIGETMAVTMVIGNVARISPSLFLPAYTIPSVIANEFTEAIGDVHLQALIELGLVLFLVTILINGIARLVIVATTQKGTTPG